MIIWISWYVLSIILMAYVGLRKYSVSNRLKKIFVEVPAEDIGGFEAICVAIEMFLVFSDVTLWENYKTWVILCGVSALLVSEFILMRIAGKATSQINLLICRRRLASIKKWAQKRHVSEFM